MLRRSTSIFIGLSLFVVFSFSSFAKMADGRKSKKIISGKDTLTELRTVIINNDYSLDLQKRMYVDTSLNSDASLQYADTANELYILVIDEPKADFIRDFKSDKLYKQKHTLVSNYRAIQMSLIKKNLKTKGKVKIKSETIQNRDAQFVDFSANVPDIDFPIYYKIGFFAGEDTLYLVMTWTLAEYKDKHNAEMDRMLHSFRMLKVGTD